MTDMLAESARLGMGEPIAISAETGVVIVFSAKLAFPSFPCLRNIML